MTECHRRPDRIETTSGRVHALPERHRRQGRRHRLDHHRRFRPLRNRRPAVACHRFQLRPIPDPAPHAHPGRLCRRRRQVPRHPGLKHQILDLRGAQPDKGSPRLLHRYLPVPRTGNNHCHRPDGRDRLLEPPCVQATVLIRRWTLLRSPLKKKRPVCLHSLKYRCRP